MVAVSCSRVSQPMSVSWSTAPISEAPADRRILVKRAQQLRLGVLRCHHDRARAAVDADQVCALGDPCGRRCSL